MTFVRPCSSPLHRMISTRNHRAPLAFAGVLQALALVAMPFAAHAEGSAQTGDNQALTTATTLRVNVLAGEVINIAAKATGGGGGVTVTVAPPSGASTTTTLTNTAGRIADATTVTPATIANPYRFTVVTAGVHSITFSQNVDLYDVTVTANASATVNTAPPSGTRGRLYSTVWDFFAPDYTATSATNANYYVVIPTGVASENYTWFLDFQGMAGRQYSIAANALGLPSPYSRSSQQQSVVPASALTSPFNLYVDLPDIANGANTSPSLTYTGLGTCGHAYAGHGGTFTYTSNINGTYQIIVDANRDGTYDQSASSADVVLTGTAVVGTNSIAWDGTTRAGVTLTTSATPFNARLVLAAGECHFLANDIETSSPGLTMELVNPSTGALGGTPMYWDDRALDLTSVPATAPPVVYTVPNGVASDANRHAWGNFNAAGNGVGNNAWIDTWVIGASSTTTFAFTLETGVCTACSSDANCAALAATPHCVTSGAYAGYCGVCNANAHCAGTTPVCAPATHTCAACTSDPDCSSRPATPACLLTGASAGSCVACTSNTNCSGATPFCSTSNSCRACGTADCTGTTPICATQGTQAGNCVSAVLTLATPADGLVTTVRRPVISGTATPFASVAITLDGTVVTTVTANASGAWTYTPTSDLSLSATVAHVVSAALVYNSASVAGAGPNSFYVVQCTGNTQCASLSATPFCNTTSKTCVSCLTNTNCTAAGHPFCDSSTQSCRACAQTDCGTTAVCVTAGTGVGTCVSATVAITVPMNGSTSLNRTPTYQGTATPSAHLRITVDGTVIGNVVVEASGNWSLAQPAGSPLSFGSHTAVASVVVTDTVLGSASTTFTVNQCDANANCSGATALCDTGTHRCVACLNNTNCSGGTPACDTASHTCRACATGTQATDCTTAGAAFCATTGALAGHCVACAANANCPVATPVCDATSRTCRTCAAGTQATDCTNAGAAFCATTGPLSGRCVACVSSASCPGANPVCDTTTNTCSSCPNDNACPSGDVCIASGSAAGTCVAISVTPVTPANPTTTTNPRPVFTGTGTPTATVVILVDGVEIGRTPIDASGNYTFTPTSDIATGLHAVTYTVATRGTTVPAAGPTALTIVARPTVVSPADGAVTPDAQPALVVNGTPNTSAAIILDGTSIGTVVLDNAGGGSLTPTTALTPGMHTVATASVVGGVTGTSSATNTFTVLSVPTVALPTPGPQTVIRRPSIPGHGAPSSTVQVSIDGSVAGTANTDASGDFAFVPTSDLAPGDHTVTAAAIVGTTVGPNGNTVTVTEVGIPVIAAPIDGAVVTVDRPVITGHGDPNSTVAVFLDGVEIGRPMTDASGNFTFTTPTDVAPGTHTVALAPIVNGMTGTAGTPNTITSTVAPFITAPANGSITSLPRPVLVGRAAPNVMVAVFVDGVPAGTVMSDATGRFTFTPPVDLAPGMHTYGAANVTSGVAGTPRTTTFTVGPAAVIDAPIDGAHVTVPRPPVTGHGNPNSTVAILVDGVQVGTTTTDNAGAFTFALPNDLSPGPHALTPEQVTSGVNGPPGATVNITVDTPPVISAPTEGQRVGTVRPMITGRGAPATLVAVFVDGVEVGRAMTDATGNFTVTPSRDLAPGPATATAATVTAGVVGTMGAPVHFVVAQGVTITSPAPRATTTDRRPVYRGHADANVMVDVQVDGVSIGRAMTDASGDFTFMQPTDLAYGAHTVAGANVIDGTVRTPGESVPFTVTMPAVADAGVDAGRDAAVEAGARDAGREAGVDASTDAGLRDAAVDAAEAGPALSLGGDGAFSCRTAAPANGHGGGDALALGALGAIALAAAARRRRSQRQH